MPDCRNLSHTLVPSLSSSVQGWPDVITKEVVDNLHKFVASVYVTLGQFKGKTLLPLPPMGAGAIDHDKDLKDKDRCVAPPYPTLYSYCIYFLHVDLDAGRMLRANSVEPLRDRVEDILLCRD